LFNGVHVLLYSPDAVADRAFIRDVLGYPSVDAHDGWLIFALPPAEVGVHPGQGATSQEIYLMCDDIEGVVAALSQKGVEVSRPIEDTPFGRLSAMRLPSGMEIAFYQPRHPVAYNLRK
jgi:uncharacterized glyoxalase superfamily protein PhnB